MLGIVEPFDREALGMTATRDRARRDLRLDLAVSQFSVDPANTASPVGRHATRSAAQGGLHGIKTFGQTGKITFFAGNHRYNKSIGNLSTVDVTFDHGETILAKSRRIKNEIVQIR
ncbi:MAG: hypothetical protein ACOH2H_00720 [Cypionkella sp.]